MSARDELDGLVTVEAVERASEDDRRWFEANPGESVRYRDLIPGEFPLPELPGGLEERLPTDRFQIEVVQLAPGARVRRLCGVLLTSAEVLGVTR